jgi:ABC-type nitrate/sulfonate/bicarbonate transport system ATPase subunit
MPMGQSHHTLEFQNISYEFTLKGGKDAGSTKQILHGVSAKCVSGRFTALMGPSGAGKSSLVRDDTSKVTLTLFQRLLMANTRAREPTAGASMQLLLALIWPTPQTAVVGLNCARLGDFMLSSTLK